MAPTRDLKGSKQAHAQRDSAFRKALLQEGIECLLAGDVDTGKRYFATISTRRSDSRNCHGSSIS
jgi:hypothetical protein